VIDGILLLVPRRASPRLSAAAPRPLLNESGRALHRLREFIVAFTGVVFLSTAVLASNVATQFDAFGLDWMSKLAARQAYNATHIKWDATAEGVTGEYIAYTPEHVCTLKNVTKAPIGKVSYVEILYQKRGSTIPEAEQSTAQVIDTTEVTEIFGYIRGKWAP
jgi:hypothetical protein